MAGRRCRSRLGGVVAGVAVTTAAGMAAAVFTAAVVGVMANFALWFAAHALFPGGMSAHPDLFVLATGLGAFLALLLWQADVMLLIGLCAALGVIVRLQ